MDLSTSGAREKAANARTSREVAELPVEGAQGLDGVGEVGVVGRGPELSGDGPADATGLRWKISIRNSNIQMLG